MPVAAPGRFVAFGDCLIHVLTQAHVVGVAGLVRMGVETIAKVLANLEVAGDAALNAAIDRGKKEIL
jgi:hypothetical protein